MPEPKWKPPRYPRPFQEGYEPPRVEDSHASTLDAETRNAVESAAWSCETRAELIAKLQSILEGRVEEKKAAVIEAAKVYSDIAGRFIRGEYKGADTLPRQVDYAREHLRLAVAALVESEKESAT